MSCVCLVQSTRERLRLTQAELARRAGLSRQVVNMVERGKILPSVLTALALAEALQCEVSDIFQKPPSQNSLEVRVSSTVTYAQGPVRLGLVGNQWVAFPGIAAKETGFGEADGQLVSRRGNTGMVRPLGAESQLSQNLLIVGLDPALGIMRDLWRRNRLEGSVRWQNLSCLSALKALASGEAHVAGVCYTDTTSELRALFALGTEVTIVRFARWELGWMVRQGNPSNIRSAKDLKKRSVRFLNQEEGAIGRAAVDSLLKQQGIPQPSSLLPLAANPFEAAGTIRDGSADVAMGLRAVAESFGLDFLPVTEVAFDLVIPRALLEMAPVSRMLGLLQNRDFRNQLAGLPGYKTDETGKRMGLSDLA